MHEDEEHQHHGQEDLDDAEHGEHEGNGNRYAATSPFLTNEAEPAPWDRCYAIATPKRAFNIFFNMTSLARAEEPGRRPGSSIMVFSPSEPAADLLEQDDEKIVSVYLRELDELFPGFPEHVVESQIRRFPMGLPYCFPRRGELQDALTRAQERVHLAGDYLGTFYTETAIETGSRAASRILAQLRSGHS